MVNKTRFASGAALLVVSSLCPVARAEFDLSAFTGVAIEVTPLTHRLVAGFTFSF